MNTHLPKEESSKPQSQQGNYSHRLSNEAAWGYHNSFRTDTDFFRQVVESLEDYAVFTTDAEGIISSWNAGAGRILGYTEEEIIGQPVAILFTPADQQAGVPGQELALAARQGQSLDQREHVKKDGSRFWASGKVFPLLDEGQQLRGFTKILRDITSLKQTRDALEESLQREQEARTRAEQQRNNLNLLLSQVPAVISVLRGPELRYELANPYVEQIAGKRDYLGKTLPEVFPEMDPGLLEIYRNVYRTGERFTGESFPIELDWDANGKPYRKYFDFVYEPFRNEQGQVEGVISFGHEVTSQLLARQQVEENALRVQTILDSMPHVARTTDTRGNNTYLNHQWYQFTGADPANPAGGDWNVYLHPQDRPGLYSQWAEAYARGETFESEYRLLHHSGVYRWMLGRTVPVRNERGQLTQWIGTCTDIHDQKIATDQFRSVLESIPSLSWTSLPNGENDYVNNHFLTYTGLSYEQVMQRGWERIIHPEDLPLTVERWTHSMQTGALYEMEYRFKRYDGAYRWHLGRGIPLRDEQGRIIKWIGTATDIHDQKVTQQQLLTLNRELAATNKELAAATGELAAASKELQASNEELAQANQQLASGEEELRQFLTQTVELNEKLAEQERFFSSILDQSPFATWIADASGTATRMNEACRKLFGLEEAGQSLGKYNILEDNTLRNEPFFKDIQAVFREGKIARFELAYDVREVEMVDVPTGKPVKVILTLFPVTNTQGRITNVVVQAEDITEQRQAESDLAYQHLLTQTITDNATLCLFMMNQQGYCTFMNPAGEKMFGYSFEEISRQPLHYMIHHHRPDGSFYPLEECPIDRALPENFDVKAHEDLFFRKDGTSFPVSCAASPIFENGTPVATVIEVRDISQEKQYQQQLLKMNAMLSTKNEDLKRINVDLDNFVYTASHDLRSPITNLAGLQKLLSKRLEGKLGGQEQEIMGMMQEAVERLNRTIKDLSDIARVQKETDLPLEQVTLRELLREVTEDIAPLIRESSARLKLDLEVESIEYPPKYLRSILYNLLSNAIKYCSPDKIPSVHVSTRKTEEGVLLTVADNGLGLEEGQLSKLFQMFKRLHTHVEGTGVGLYMIKRIVENYGGRITVESQPGVGTTFRVYFKQQAINEPSGSSSIK